MMSAEHPRPVSDDWYATAACKGMDPELFFPLAGELLVVVVETCRTCPSSEGCLDDALTNGTYARDGLGYRAGTDERQRYNLRRAARRRAEKEAS